MKGVFVGVSTVVTTAIAVMIGVAGGLEPRSSMLFAHSVCGAGTTVVVYGLSPAILFGAMLGAIELDVPPLARTAIFVVVALLALVLCLPFWPGLAPFAVPITVVHAMALARWTAPGDALPRAIVRRTR